MQQANNIHEVYLSLADVFMSSVMTGSGTGFMLAAVRASSDVHARSERWPAVWSDRSPLPGEVTSALPPRTSCGLASWASRSFSSSVLFPLQWVRQALVWLVIQDTAQNPLSHKCPLPKATCLKGVLSNRVVISALICWLTSLKEDNGSDVAPASKGNGYYISE
jgi:hypothetical protein